jgi:glycosyltransferase involved in cell wall biosynthesis
MKYDVIIGANNFDTCSAIIINKIFHKEKTETIYFASDYSEHRFSNSILNTIYYRIEQYALKFSNIVISNTLRAEAKRRELGLSPEKSIVIFNTAYVKDATFPNKEINKSHFLYVGSLTKEHGLGSFIQVAHPLINKLTIIGDGTERENILKTCKKYHINVTYLGQREHKFILEFMQKFNGLGIAPYSMAAAKYVYYGSSLKIYEYLACGLPVVTSSVTEQSKFISEFKLGVVYEQLDLHKLSDTLLHFNLGGFNIKARRFYEEFNQDIQYKKIKLAEIV